MTQDSKQALFGELRSMLAQADKNQRWGAQLIKLLSQAHERLGQAQYEQSWLPYLAGAQASLPQPLCTLKSFQALERACILAPLASFTLKLKSCDVFALASSPCLSQLVYLKLKNNHMRDEGAAALASSPHLSQLTHLILDNNHIGDEGVKALASSPYLSQLTQLNLNSNEIRDEGAKALASSPYLSQITHLYLYDNEIGDKGAKALASSPCLSQLTYLYLILNNIGAEGAKALASSPYLCESIRKQWERD